MENQASQAQFMAQHGLLFWNMLMEVGPLSSLLALKGLPTISFQMVHGVILEYSHLMLGYFALNLQSVIALRFWDLYPETSQRGKLSSIDVKLLSYFYVLLRFVE